MFRAVDVGFLYADDNPGFGETAPAVPDGFSHARRKVGKGGCFSRIEDAEALLFTFPELELVNELAFDPYASARFAGNWTEDGSGADS